jgi:hypothetical protein
MAFISTLCSSSPLAPAASFYARGSAYSEHSHGSHYTPVLLVRESTECGLRKVGLGEGAALSVKLLGRHDGGRERY